MRCCLLASSRRTIQAGTTRFFPFVYTYGTRSLVSLFRRLSMLTYICATTTSSCSINIPIISLRCFFFYSLNFTNSFPYIHAGYNFLIPPSTSFHSAMINEISKRMQRDTFFLLILHRVSLFNASHIPVIIPKATSSSREFLQSNAVTSELPSPFDSRRWNSFSESCFKVHGTMGAARISPFAISRRLMVDTHDGTRERRSRIARCVPSVVLTNVRPKIRLTGPGPAFTSPLLQRSLAPFLVSRSSRPHSISTPTSAV